MMTDKANHFRSYGEASQHHDGSTCKTHFFPRFVGDDGKTNISWSHVVERMKAEHCDSTASLSTERLFFVSPGRERTPVGLWVRYPILKTTSPILQVLSSLQHRPVWAE